MCKFIRLSQSSSLDKTSYIHAIKNLANYSFELCNINFTWFSQLKTVSLWASNEILRNMDNLKPKLLKDSEINVWA